MNLSEGLRRSVERWAQDEGAEGAVTIEAIAGGRNNRAYRVEAGAQRFFLKVYFRHPGDPRDRAGTELAFCRFAHAAGTTAVPRPIGHDTDKGAALYQWIEGRRLEPDEVTSDHVGQALALVEVLDGHRDDEATAALPPASEACFSIAEHVETVARRVERLERLELTDEVAEEARELVVTRLCPAWERVRASVLDEESHEVLERSERVLSPSDFGFHNALATEGGRLVFVDFEYAGWDDPAKLVGDFFCQPEVPVPESSFEHVVDFLALRYPEPWRLRQRIDVLRPVYRIKWACIVLNEFLPADSARRRFSSSADELHTRRRAQLAKARRFLE